jgi:hypothetical protein
MGKRRPTLINGLKRGLHQNLDLSKVWFWSFFFSIDALWNLLYVSKRFDLALMPSKIKGDKGGLKGPTPGDSFWFI